MPAQTEYDRVAYPDLPFAQSQPDRLAGLATLHGLRPAEPDTARVLDLGCGAGANALAIAAAWPEVTVVGADLATTAIDKARTAAEAMGIHNARFEVADLCDLTEGGLGTFDYVIAHGIYAWVPEPVRDALLASFSSHLSPEGIALVSYTVNPGGYVARALREAALWHARASREPMERSRRAHELFLLLKEAADLGAPTYAGMAAPALADLLDTGPEALHHDILGDAWDPVWFADFVAHARAHELDYVCEAWVRRARPAGVLRLLERLGASDRIEAEQYADIILGRRFRVSLLCRDGSRVCPEPDPEAVRRVVFTAADAAGERADPAWRAIAAALAEARPAALAFDELQVATALEPDALASHLIAAAGEGIAIPRGARPLVARTAGEFPVAYPLARWQAAEGQPITTLNGDFVSVTDAPSRCVLGLLDGTRDREAIRADFEQRVGLTVAASKLGENLDRLAGLGLLMA